MPRDSVPLTSKGWPYIDPELYFRAFPAYTQQLATKLDNADADVAAAINAAARAEAAAGTAVAAAARMSAGSAAISITSATAGTVSVTFPARRFTAAPIVQVSRATSGLAKCIPYVASVTASGCVLGLYSGDGTTASGSSSLAWFAYQIPA